MYPAVDFDDLGYLVNEFEEKTQPRFGSKDSQVGNMISLLGISEDNLKKLLSIAHEYAKEEEDKELLFRLRSMFMIGFLVALYSMGDKNINPLCVH